MPAEPWIHSIRHHATLKYLACVVCVTICLLLTACQSIPSGFSGGETVTPEKLHEISASIFTEPIEPGTSIPPLDRDLAGYTGKVWWTKGGTVVHIDRDCYHISHASSLQSGSPTDAALAGKTALCATCRKHVYETDADVRSNPVSSTP